VRSRISGTPERPRLAVYKSLQYIYAQVIDDGSGRTIAQANSAEPGLRAGLGTSSKNLDAARLVGETVAARAIEKGVKQVVFDRGGYIYHGRVRKVAEGARAKGLEF
jgi:large subunit ribosomal protein L18